MVLLRCRRRPQVDVLGEDCDDTEELLREFVRNGRTRDSRSIGRSPATHQYRRLVVPDEFDRAGSGPLEHVEQERART